MTTILALETSRSLCSVALRHNAELFEDTRKVERLHNEVVLGMVDGLFDRAGVAASTLDVVAFGAGPGSFTGVRIAAAVAQGIAFGSGSQIVAVPSSLATAHGAMARLEPTPSRLLTMTRSHRDAYYLAGYEVRAGVLELSMADVLCTGWPAAVLRSSWVAVGDKPPWWERWDREEGREAAEGQNQTLEWGGEVDLTAALIAELALRIHADGAALDPAAGLPIYVGGDSPWGKVEV
jgi:tRNA threonylcarbamoyladenosine biosynthesis protein TsaB